MMFKTGFLFEMYNWLIIFLWLNTKNIRNVLIEHILNLVLAYFNHSLPLKYTVKILNDFLKTHSS